MKLNTDQKNIISSILERVRDYRIKHNWNNNEIVLIDFDILFKKILIDKDKIDICNLFLSINPLKVGFKGIRYEDKGVFDKDIFRKVSGQKLNNGAKINVQYISYDVYRRFKNMLFFLEREVGKSVAIQSGYRSPAYQLIVFFWNLRDSDYDFDKVVKKVALPFYSEHGSLDSQAIDIIAPEFNSLFDRVKFETTPQYRWLKKNGECFGFYESYSKNNNLGVIYEPWHWHFENKKDE